MTGFPYLAQKPRWPWAREGLPHSTGAGPCAKLVARVTASEVQVDLKVSIRGAGVVDLGLPAGVFKVSPFPDLQDTPRNSAGFSLLIVAFFRLQEGTSWRNVDRLVCLPSSKC